MKAIAVIFFLVGMTNSAPQGGYNPNHGNIIQPSALQTLQAPHLGDGGQFGHYSPAQYEFQYEINDDFAGSYYGHSETREGPYTQGSYYVQLPDSRVMRVDYYADEFGYHPTVTYEGEAQFPSSPADLYGQQGLGLAPNDVLAGRPGVLAPSRVPVPVSPISQPSPNRLPLTNFSPVHRPVGLSRPNFGISPVPSRLFSLPGAASSPQQVVQNPEIQIIPATPQLILQDQGPVPTNVFK